MKGASAGMVYRVYVEKKEALANEARALLEDLREFLGIRSLTGIRLLNRYDLENISRELFDYAVKTVLSEPQLDTVSYDPPEGGTVFAVEYLPGQYDQRADSAAQCIQILSQGERPVVRTARVYVLEGKLTEEEAQELIDQFIIKLRIVRFLRTPEYNDLFSGDPVWVTESLGGQGVDGRSLVTKTSYRYLYTLYNLGPAPEPNLTVLWFNNAPDNWKNFCAKVSIDTSAIQYENDDLMRPDYGDDYGIACCVSPMKIGKQMQYFGARANLAKCLLYAINGGRDEKSGVQVAPRFEPITSEYLDYNEVMEKYEQMMRWLAKVYVNALKIIHYMHDKYAYEAFEMGLHDGDVERIRATGIAGLSIVADSLAAIRDTKVKVIRDERGLAVDFEREGEYVPFGNNDDRTDSIAVDITEKFMEYLRQHQTYRKATPTQSILTITSNVVYGKKTGTTPDGRPGGTPFAPGANPMNGRDTKGAVAALASVAKLPFQHAHDGISYTFAVSPATLGKERDIQVSNLVSLLDGYFTPDGGQHLNVNVFDKDLLLDAMEHPEKYPQLTIRVSGYAVNFVKLTREQQLDVISRTINSSL